MRAALTRCLAAILATAAALSAQDAPHAQPAAGAAKLTFHCDGPATPVSKRLYGIFFEEINHAGEGGLYAQLLRNPTFEEPTDDPNKVPGWSLELAPGAAATMRLDTEAPANAATPHSLRLELQASRAAVVAAGHFGVPLQNGADYVLELHARGDRKATLHATLTAADSTELATGTAAITADWTQIRLTMQPPATLATARLRLEPEGPGTFWFDSVTLRPAHTFRGHGLRQDLADKLAALAPSFVRFPGGCYVEGGDLLRDAFRWQQTLGALDDRPGHQNTNWGYWSSDGLGYHEYLQLCEDLGAEPMFVVNCGMSHKETVPMDQLGPWVQSALDAIEYANGGADTTWGRRRAAAGHPAPFGLTLVEIGNENGMFGNFGGTRAQYAERYEVFRTAIKARWPDVVTISNTRVDRPMEIVDDHYYQSSSWFWSEADRYAQAKANAPKIYVGEYAVTVDPGRTGNLRAALGEAAFLCGLERAGDHVVMASYAPLFVHVQDRKWNPDLIQFDGLRSCGMPGYWVQVLFARNRVATTLPVDLPQSAGEAAAGSIGLGTWNTQAEFKDIAVAIAGRQAYAADFARGTDGWQIERGEWQVHDGAFRQGQQGDMRWARLELPALRGATDYVLTCKARKLGGAEGFLLLFHVAGAQDWTWFNVGGWGNKEHAIERCAGGSKFGIGPHVRGSVEVGRWYELRVELQDGRIRTFLDGEQVHDQQDRGLPSFTATAGRAADGSLVLKVVNGGNRDRPITVQLQGAGTVAGASGEVLTAASADD